MSMWKSSLDIMHYAEIVPEVVGTKTEIIRDGLSPEKKPGTPPPICKEVGYTPLELLRHWVKTGVVQRAPAEEYRKECLRLIEMRLAHERM